ncbi:hypothetical protein ACHHYP_08233 [Achlya hypogyna]|uniref:CRAL-TRIO domain-containing protein n=1 Tax=Achlya hypogyna TaxID=1202772 RepID=A0A1V9ZL26_ACHHY|nr:hypothetical protein ACHHYP_08233 [Achlya hypogyna]
MKDAVQATFHIVVVVFSCCIHVSITVAITVSIAAAALRLASLHRQARVVAIADALGTKVDDAATPEAATAKPTRTLHRARVVFTGVALGSDSKAQDKSRMYFSLEIAPTDGAPWTIHRSYSDFRALRNTLMATSLYFQHHSFPPRSPFGNWLVNYAKRTQGLVAFVTYVVQHDVLSRLPAVVAFFAMPELEPTPVDLDMPHAHERHWDTLSAEQRAMMATLQQRLSADDLYRCPIVLLRHLQAAAWSLPTAQARLETVLGWRATSLPRSFDMDVLAHELSTGKLYVADFLTHDDRALAIVKLYKENTWSAEHYVTNIMYTIEHGLRRVSPVHAMSVVIDFTNYSLQYCPDMAAFQDFVTMVEKYYMEHLGTIYLVDLPWVYANMLCVIKPLLNATTRSKLTLVKSSNLRAIADAIDPTELLRHVGPRPSFELDVASYLRPF